MPASLSWQHGGDPRQVDSLLSDLEAKAEGATYVLVHAADLRWMLREMKIIADERERIERFRKLVNEFAAGHQEIGAISLWAK